MIDATLDELAAVIASGEAMLFTGAGFSSDARDRDGRPLPDGKQMIAELWPLCFADAGPDDSTLADLYDVALRRVPARLRAYVERRLVIGDAPLPPHLGRWFAARWRRIYTLNVDDLELAVARQFALPHRLRPVSATAPAPAADDPSVAAAAGATIDVVHLNGYAPADLEQLTFSTLQYAARLCRHDREYARLAADLGRAPFVFAGTTLDEVILWQHLELHRRRDGDPPARPRSYLVSSSLPRARRALLEALAIRWIPASIAAVADRVFART